MFRNTNLYFGFVTDI